MSAFGPKIPTLPVRRVDRYTLPHTGISLDMPVEVSAFQEMETHRDVAYGIRVHIDGVHIGEIDNSGTGGMTLLRTINPYRAAWQAVVDGALSRDGKPMAENDLFEELVEEAEFVQHVASVGRSKKKYPVRWFQQYHLYSGDKIHSTHTARITDLATFPRAINLTPETAHLPFSDVEVPEDVLSAEVWVQGQWVRFYPRPS